MASVPLVHSNEQMAYAQAALQGYGRRVLVENEALAEDEEQHKTSIMQEYMAMATSYKCTEKEVVRLLFKGFFK